MTREDTKKLLGESGKYTALVVGALASLIPLVVVFMAAFKTKEEFQSTGPFVPPDSLYLENFARAWSDGRMAMAFVNTTIILLFAIVGTVAIGTMAAFAVDRFEFRGKRLAVFLFLAAALVPGVTTQVATFQVVNWFGLFNSRWAAIVLFMGTDIIAIYIFLQFMRSIPRALDEAALTEGASYWTIYRRIVLPLLKPAIATVVIIKGVAVYNEFYIPFLYMPARDLGVVSTALFRFKGPYGTEWEIISAGIVLAIVPTLVAFIALQRWIYNGFTAGGVK